MPRRTPEAEESLLTRRQERVSLGLTKRGLRDHKTQAAIESMISPSLMALVHAIESLATKDRHFPLYDQLGQMDALTSIGLPESVELLPALRTSVEQAQRERARAELPEVLDKMGERYTEELKAKVFPKYGLEPTVLAIRALRNLSVISDEIIKQTLWDIQGLGPLSFGGLAAVWGQAAERLKLKPEGVPEQSLDKVVKELLLGEQFITTAERGIKRERRLILGQRLGIDEPPEETEHRAKPLCQVMAVMAHEYLTDHGSDPNVLEYIAQQLVRSHFAHRIHHVNPKQQVLRLCQELLSPTLQPTALANGEEIALQFLLEAQRAQLVFPEELGEDDYRKLGLDPRLYDKHQRQLLAPPVRYVEDPIPHIPFGSGVMTFRGFFNFGHEGYVALITETMRALKRFIPKPEGGWTMVVSVNRRDEERERRQLIAGSPPALPLKTRVTLVEQALTGFRDGNIVLTSIEKEPITFNEMPGTLVDFARELKETRGVKTVGRGCGFERIDLTPSGIDPIFIALRGTDLVNFLQNPETVGELQERFRTNEIYLLLLSGVMNISATDVWGKAIEYLTTGKERRLWGLRSMTHRKVIGPILDITRDYLGGR